LKIDTELRAQPGAYLGAVVGNPGRSGRGAATNGAQVISHIDYDSPAGRSGLSVGDEILAIDGARVANLNDWLRERKQGEGIKMLVVRDLRVREIEVVLGSKMERSFKIEPTENPSRLQSAILKAVLK